MAASFRDMYKAWARDLKGRKFAEFVGREFYMAGTESKRVFEDWWELLTESKGDQVRYYLQQKFIKKAEAKTCYEAGQEAARELEEVRQSYEGKPLRERLSIELDRTASWPDGCGGELIVRLVLDGEVISEAEASG